MKTALIVGLAFIVFAAFIIGVSLKKSSKKATGKGSGVGGGSETEIEKPNKY